MKQFLIISLFFTLNIFAQDPIEKAIMETDIHAFEELLSARVYFSDLDKIRYLDLAQEVINEINNIIFMERIRPHGHSGFIPIAILGTVFGSIGAFMYFINYEYKQQGILPLIITGAATIGIMYCAARGTLEEREFKKNLDQKRLDAIAIKQYIFVH